MRKILILMMLLTAVPASWAQTTGGIKFFQGTFEQALAEAKKTNKVLFVDFYATWCVPCKHMAKEVFTVDSVGDYFNKHFVSIQVDAEKPANKPWAEKYKVEAYPTTAFIDASGKTLLQNMGMLRAPELMEAARTAMGEMVNFEQLYDNYKKDPKNLATAQQLLLKAPSFLAAQDGIEAEKWVTRIGKIYKDYLKEKWGDALINKKDYVIINALGGDNAEDTQVMMDFINDNLDKWIAAVGKAPVYYIIENNDAMTEKLVKDGNPKYKDYVEKVKGVYAKAYAHADFNGMTAYQWSKTYYDALFNLHKNKDTGNFTARMNSLFKALGDKTQSSDYGKAAQDLYNAAGKKLTADDHHQAISWVEQALKGENDVTSKINYLIMLGDSYKFLKDYNKARSYYNQGYALTLQMGQMEMTQQMMQFSIKRKLSELELLEK